ncbi:hypothetical protein FKP32DRAFT_1106671 [Trametes sanguinea]|nr:hypothetical protein FKP32DRAFT_1106671 [Trametes sanguinea]
MQACMDASPARCAKLRICVFGRVASAAKNTCALRILRRRTRDAEGGEAFSSSGNYMYSVYRVSNRPGPGGARCGGGHWVRVRRLDAMRCSRWPGDRAGKGVRAAIRGIDETFRSALCIDLDGHERACSSTTRGSCYLLPRTKQAVGLQMQHRRISSNQQQLALARSMERA